MQHRHAISDDDRDRIKHLLPGLRGQHGEVAKDNRLFLDAVLWIAKTGSPWRDPPGRFGDWDRAWRRLDRWAKEGVWRRVFEALPDPDLEWVILDSAIVRAHPHAAGAKRKRAATGAKSIRPWAGAGAGSGPRSTAPSAASGSRRRSS